MVSWVVSWVLTSTAWNLETGSLVFPGTSDVRKDDKDRHPLSFRGNIASEFVQCSAVPWTEQVRYGFPWLLVRVVTVIEHESCKGQAPVLALSGSVVYQARTLGFAERRHKQMRQRIDEEAFFECCKFSFRHR